MARTQGMDLLDRLNEGKIEVAPSEFLKQTRDDVCVAIEELLDVGARIRPLYAGKLRVGWIRGVHLSERRALRRWVPDEIEFVELLLGMSTTLTPDQIRNLTLIELRSLSRVVKAMSDSDLQLYSYISAFVTTSHSEQLWFSGGIGLSSFRERILRMREGAGSGSPRRLGWVPSDINRDAHPRAEEESKINFPPNWVWARFLGIYKCTHLAQRKLP